MNTLVSSTSVQTMETLSKAAIMKNLANRKQHFFGMKTFVEKAVPYVLQSSEKNKNKTES